MDVGNLISSLPSWPEVDFAELGEIEVRELTRVQRLTGQFLARNWIAIPHATHHDEIDFTDAEMRRAAWNQEHPSAKATPVELLVKALALVLPQLGATAMRERPQRGPQGELLWRKMLPLSLSYDHRVINGADAARFVQAIGKVAAGDQLFS